MFNILSNPDIVKISLMVSLRFVMVNGIPSGFNFFSIMTNALSPALEMVRKLDPLLIVPGTEDGVILATKLANDLNLLCNPIENLDAITLKNEMQNRLAEKKILDTFGANW